MSRGTTSYFSPRAVAWLALLVTGQAASLALSFAGRRVNYQHYRLDQLAARPWSLVAVVLLALQLALVTWGMRGKWEGVRRWMGENVPPAAARSLHEFLGNVSTNYLELAGVGHLMDGPSWEQAMSATIAWIAKP